MKDIILYGEWPVDHLKCIIYAHYLMGYRYHWHETEYELDIILHGRASFCRGNDIYTLEEDDAILIDPGIGHASLALEPDSIVLVMRFPETVFRPYLGVDKRFSFEACCSDASSRKARKYELIRFHAAQIFHAISRGFPLSQLNARANLELLMVDLHRDFSSVRAENVEIPPEYNVRITKQIKTFLEKRYAEKITLDDLASLTGYHKNYISSFFKKHTGSTFYNYLMRIRFQNAVFDLNFTQKTLTEIAIDNGFAELKLFNRQFKELFRMSPAEYRENIVRSPTFKKWEDDQYFPPTHPLVLKKIKQFSQLTDTSPYDMD